MNLIESFEEITKKVDEDKNVDGVSVKYLIRLIMVGCSGRLDHMGSRVC